MKQRRRGDGWKHRPHHRAFTRLPASARQRAITGFRFGEPTTAIVEVLARDHGATIAVSSLNRYREWWETTERPALEAADKAQELMVAFKEHPTELEPVIRQLLQAQRLAAMTEDRAPDPTALGRLDLEERRLRLQERELALRERALEERVKAAGDNVEQELKRANLDAATIAKIRQEVYGLAS